VGTTGFERSVGDEWEESAKSSSTLWGVAARSGMLGCGSIWLELRAVSSMLTRLDSAAIPRGAAVTAAGTVRADLVDRIGRRVDVVDLPSLWTSSIVACSSYVDQELA